MTTTFTGHKSHGNLKFVPVFSGGSRVPSLMKAHSPDRFEKTNRPLFSGGGQVLVEDSPRPSLFITILVGFMGVAEDLITQKNEPSRIVRDLVRSKEKYDELVDKLPELRNGVRLTEDQGFFSGKTYLQDAIEAGNYKAALLLASYGANPRGKDRGGDSALTYVDRRTDLTKEGRKLLKKRLNELYTSQTTYTARENLANMPRLRADIPSFVNSLPNS